MDSDQISHSDVPGATGKGRAVRRMLIGGVVALLAIAGVAIVGAQVTGSRSGAYANGKSFTYVAAGWNHSCGLVSDPTVNVKVQCWGNDSVGELGNGLFATYAVSPSAEVTDSNNAIINNAISISAGNEVSCAVLTDGTVKCWGKGASWQLGNSNQTNMSRAVTVMQNASTPLTGVTAVSVGGNHVCAVLANRTVSCWGWNNANQMGNGSFTINFKTPTLIVGITEAIAVSANNQHSCALLSTGSVTCWGSDGGTGGLGTGTALQTNSGPKVVVPGINDAISVSAGWSHSCAALTVGKVYCWGNGGNGQLGNGNNYSTNTPVEVVGIANATSVTAGYLHSCARLQDGTVKCWGYNGTYGALGNNSTLQSTRPVVVTGINNAISVSAYGNSTCAALSDGTAQCWGDYNAGQLGNGTRSRAASDPLTPVLVNTP